MLGARYEKDSDCEYFIPLGLLKLYFRDFFSGLDYCN